MIPPSLHRIENELEQSVNVLLVHSFELVLFCLCTLSVC